MGSMAPPPAPTRRSVLAGLGAAACAPGDAAVSAQGQAPSGSGSAPTPPPPPHVQPVLDEVAFPYGVSAGDPRHDGVVLSVRTVEPVVGLWVDADDGAGGDVRVVESSGLVPEDAVVQVELGGLVADREHHYGFVSADGARGSIVGRFRTAPAPGSRRTLRLGATSCLGIANPRWPTLARAADDGLDVFVLLGDAIYTRAIDAAGYEAEYDALLSEPSAQALFARAPVAATWDDHEVANDWVLGERDPTGHVVDAVRVDAALGAFRRAIPQTVGPTGGVWRSLAFGDTAELLLLDCRSERTPGGTGVEPRMLGDAQLDWLLDRLRASSAVWKLVVTSVHVTDHGPNLGESDLADRWQGFPAQRAALLAVAAAVPGVLFLTGDLHYGGIQQVDPDGGVGDGLREVAAGPSGSLPFAVSRWLADTGADTHQYVALCDTWSYARITLDPDASTAFVELVGDDGAVVGSSTLYSRSPSLRTDERQ